MTDLFDTRGEPWYVAPFLALTLLLFAVITAPFLWIKLLFGGNDS